MTYEKFYKDVVSRVKEIYPNKPLYLDDLEEMYINRCLVEDAAKAIAFDSAWANGEIDMKNPFNPFES